MIHGYIMIHVPSTLYIYLFRTEVHGIITLQKCACEQKWCNYIVHSVINMKSSSSWLSNCEQVGVNIL